MTTLLLAVVLSAPLGPGDTITLPIDRGDLVQRPIKVALPKKTPFDSGSVEEARYLRGYSEGYADAVRRHLHCRARIGERAPQAWADGWLAGYRVGEKVKLER
jgi:hypothetical protein